MDVVKMTLVGLTVKTSVSALETVMIRVALGA